MKNFKIMNINLAENYALTKIDNEALKEVIKENDPLIVTMQNSTVSTRMSLKKDLCDNYLLLDSNGKIEETMLLKRPAPRLYDKYLNLSLPITEQMRIDNKYDEHNCQVVVTGIAGKYLTCINSRIDKIIDLKSEYQLMQLEKLIEYHQNKQTIYGTDMQIVAGDFKDSKKIMDLCLRHDLCDISTDISSKEHILVSNNLEVNDIDTCKVKTKGFRDNYATLVDLSIKKDFS